MRNEGKDWAEKEAGKLSDRIKFEIEQMTMMGGYGGSNKIATMHFYECVNRLGAEALRKVRRETVEECAGIAETQPNQNFGRGVAKAIRQLEGLNG